MFSAWQIHRMDVNYIVISIRNEVDKIKYVKLWKVQEFRIHAQCGGLDFRDMVQWQKGPRIVGFYLYK